MSQCACATGTFNMCFLQYLRRFRAQALLPAASHSENGFPDTRESRDTPKGSDYAETRQKNDRIDVRKRKERSIVCKGRGGGNKGD